jgi:hypothetical protein
MTTLFDSRPLRVFTFEGVFMGRAERVRVEVEIPVDRSWTTLAIWVNGSREDTLWLDLTGLRVPPPEAPTNAWDAFGKTLFNLIEREVAKWYLTPAPEKPCEPPTPLSKRLVRTFLAWVREG